MFVPVVSFATPVPPTPASSAEESPRWAFAAYAGLFNATDLRQIFKFDTLLDALPLYAAEVSYIPSSTNSLQKHLNRWGLQMEWNMNVSFTNYAQPVWMFAPYFDLRFTHFPWNRYLYTTFAIGEGISWANHVPHYEWNPQYGIYSTHLLNFLMVEISVAPPQYRNKMAFFLRVHHRSGVYGLFYPYAAHDYVPVGSNFLAVGIRLYF